MWSALQINEYTRQYILPGVFLFYSLPFAHIQL